MYKAILWDNDGILVETEKWYFEATKKIMEKEGYKLTLDTYREYFLKNNNGAWHLLKNTNTDYIRALRNKRNELYSIYLKEKHIFTKDISKLLSSLNTKYKMGIVTSSRKDHFDIIHQRNNLLQYFNFGTRVLLRKGEYLYCVFSPSYRFLQVYTYGYKIIGLTH